MSTTRGRSGRGARRAVELLLSAALVALPLAPAHADGPPSPPPRWHEGVSEERKQKALSLFLEGRTAHRALMLADARAKYEEALKYWEHPGLRFYLGRVLRRIGLPLLSYENLQKALAWGPGALDPDEDKEAHAEVQELLQKELAAITIACDEPGAAVQLDGKPWFVGPGKKHQKVTPGEHVITAKKVGYYTVVKPVVVLAGKEAAGAIQMSVDATLSRRLWPEWRPWAVVGAGAAVSLLGAGLYALAKRDYDAADTTIAQSCPLSCLPDRKGAYDRSQWEHGFAIGSFVVGGATVLTGSVLALLNRPQPYHTEDRGAVKVEVAPLVSASATGLSMRFSF